jgi:hypothetical protein
MPRLIMPIKNDATEIYSVTTALDKIREYAPFPRDICDIVASYSMTIGDLLAYMPNVWRQDDDTPYEYPESVYGEGRVYCSGTYIRPEFEAFNHADDLELELAGVDDLFSLLAYCHHEDHGGNMPILYMPHAEIRKISDYYERIARECLEHLLSATTRE